MSRVQYQEGVRRRTPMLNTRRASGGASWTGGGGGVQTTSPSPARGGPDWYLGILGGQKFPFLFQESGKTLSWKKMKNW